jgi:calcineurin-like phosphoesterase family protein
VNIFFTADLHLGHKKLVADGLRPFQSIEEHNETIIERWNKKVNVYDTVYVLGDVVWGREYQILERLKGNIFIIEGNHDRMNILRKAKADRIIEGYLSSYLLSYDKKYVWMSHYPHRSWNRSFHGSYHAYGHVHNTLPDYGLSTDVGVDKWDFTPVSWEEFKAYMENKVIEETYVRN